MWSERTGSGWGLRGGWAGHDQEAALWLCGESRVLEMPCQHSLACISLLPSAQLSQKRWLKVVSKFCKIRNKPNSKKSQVGRLYPELGWDL